MDSPSAKRQKLDDEAASSIVTDAAQEEVAAQVSTSKVQRKKAAPKKPAGEKGKTPASKASTSKTPASKASTSKTPASKASTSKASTSKASASGSPDTKARKARETQLEKVNRLLLQAGFKKPQKSSLCARAGLIRGHFGFKFTGEAAQLDVVVVEAKCKDLGFSDQLNCPGTLKATVRKLLEQADHGGDYEEGSEKASVVCDSCDARSYVSRCCIKDFSFDCGKFHNHCKKCPVLGKCIGDYREVHCNRCGKHRWHGTRCNCAEKRREAAAAKKFGPMQQAALMLSLMSRKW